LQLASYVNHDGIPCVEAPINLESPRKLGWVSLHLAIDLHLRFHNDQHTEKTERL